MKLMETVMGSVNCVDLWFLPAGTRSIADGHVRLYHESLKGLGTAWQKSMIKQECRPRLVCFESNGHRPAQIVSGFARLQSNEKSFVRSYQSSISKLCQESGRE